MIYLNPHSGLANRIRAIISGMALANHLQQKLTVIWRKDNALSDIASRINNIPIEIIKKKVE